MPYLEVPGASLYYETYGHGPLLLLIPGADGRGSIFHSVAQFLSARFTVICYDRRGYSRSVFTGSQDFAQRLRTDADDAYHLITHLSKGTPGHSQATIFGTSAGAIVAHKILEQHPDCVTTIISHEPPAFQALPLEISKKSNAFLQNVHDTYRNHGPIAAMDVFTADIPQASEAEEGLFLREANNPARGDEIRANTMFFFEFELRQYPGSEAPLEAITAAREKYVPTAGIESGDAPGVAPIAAISKLIGKDITRLPGGHVGFQTQPKQWAHALLKALS